MTRRTQLLLAGLVGVALLLPAAADARKVGNPGSFTATVTTGSIRIKDQTFNFDGSQPIAFTGGTIQANGDFTFPASNNYFPPLHMSSGGFDLTIYIRVPQPITGNLNPMTGVSSLRLPVWIKIDGLGGFPVNGGGCRIASSTSPIVVNPLITGSTGPTPPNPSITGTPYNVTNGTMRLVNNNFAVPESSECGLAGGTVNSELGLPSASGNNDAQFNLGLNPIITKGVNASFTATPSSGKAPLTTTLNASGSFVPAGVRTCASLSPPSANCGYRWDFDNNGSVDQVTNTASVNHTYNTVGAHTARVTIFDVDQDSDTTTRTVTATQPNPDLSIDKAHSGNFLAGGEGSHTLTVSNAPGADPTLAGQNITVTDSLPAGLSFVSATGSGWGCSHSSGTVTCTRSTSLAAGASAPAITLTTAVGAAAYPSVTNTASVSVPGDTNAANNSDSDPTTVDRIDLAIVKSHTGDFRTGPTEIYDLTVTNPGTVPTSGAATITDNLPAGLTYRGFEGPEGWNCSSAGQLVTCSHPDSIPVGYDETIHLEVSASALAVGQLTNTAVISTPNDTFAPNNSSSDPTTVVPTVDLELEKAASGGFRAGSPAAYTLTVRNVGARDSSGTTVVTDSVPSELPVSSAAGPGWDCSASAGQEVSCESSAVIGPGEAADPISIAVQVLPEALPEVVNTAEMANDATGDETDINPENDSDSVTTPITATDLGIDKSHVGGFPVGGQASYTLSVHNFGSAATVGTTTVTDELPAELSYAGATGPGWACSADGQTVTCTRAASIGPEQTAPPINLQVAVANTQAEETVNTASVSTADDINAENDSDSDPTPLTAADLALTKSHSSAFRVGTTRAYTLRARNIGSQATTGTTTVTDELPEGLSYVAATGSGWACDAAGQEVTCERSAPIASGVNAPAITLQVAVGSDAFPGVTNVANVSNDDDRNDANDSASDPTDVVGNDLALSKSHVGALQVGGRASYLIDINNVGTAATNEPAVVTDQLPEGLSYVSSPSPAWDCEVTGQDVTCEHPGGIPAGEGTQTLELIVDVGLDTASEITNTASVSVPHDVDDSNDSDGDTASIGRVDLALDKTHEGDLRRGEEATYTLEVSNLGSDPTTAPVRVTDQLPAGVSFAAATGEGWSCSASAGTVSCTHAGVIPGGGAAAPIQLTVNVGLGAPAQVTNTASVASNGDMNSSNDSDSDEADVTSTIDAAVSIRPTPPATAFRVGTDGTYTVAVRNAGAAAIPGPVTATVALPAGLGYADATGAGWGCSAAGQQVTCTRSGGLAEGARSDVSLDVSVSKQAVPAVTTTAQVSAPGDGYASNDTASATTDVAMVDLAVSMQRSGSFDVGGAGVFTVGVENVGSASTISPATVSAQVPAGMTIGSAAGDGWSCSISGQGINCVRPAPLAIGAQAAPIAIAVSPTNAIAGMLVTATAALSTHGDAEAANDTASASATIGAAQAQTLGKVKAKAKCKPKKGKKGKKKKCKKKKKKKK